MFVSFVLERLNFLLLFPGLNLCVLLNEGFLSVVFIEILLHFHKGV